MNNAERPLGTRRGHAIVAGVIGLVSLTAMPSATAQNAPQTVPPSQAAPSSPQPPAVRESTGAPVTTLPIPRQAPADQPTRPSAAGDRASALPLETRRITFSSLSNKPAMHLRSTQGQASLAFGTRADELVTDAVIKLRYTYSPALIPGQSHIKVLLNGEIVSVLPIDKENAGLPQERELRLDPRFISGFNKLTLDFVGHYTNECEDHLHTSLWADISGSSELLMTVQPLVLRNDLAQLPQPFFDKQDLTRLKLPYVFAAAPSHMTLQAAGITSSWFGKLASWRGARFTSYLDEVPKGHAVVFATNAERPGFLKKLPPFAGPALSIMTNPADSFSKLIVVSGRDGKDLIMAANALVLGNAAMSGDHINITGLREEAHRRAYDAPNWVRMDRPMTFNEMIESPEKLQVFGHVTDPVLLNMRVPPDLYAWHSNGVPVEFKFRYTPPIRPGESRLSMSINDELIQGVNLRSSGPGSGALRVALPALDKNLLTERRNVLIPAHKLDVRNELAYSFSFTYQKEGACRDTHVENVRAMIDGDSTIDFSGFPHYAKMPHLGYFATAGFPFTKYADLAQTTVVMPDQPTRQDIDVMLTLLGRMGESSGYPATRVTVAGTRDAALLKDRDLLLIGTAPRLALLDQWGDRLPAVISGRDRRISQPARPANLLLERLGFRDAADADVAVQNMMHGDGPLAAMLGFESPLSPERSVVAVTAVQDKDLIRVLDSLENEELVRSMHGSAVFMRGDRAESVMAGQTYTLGALPLSVTARMWLSDRPVLFAGLSVAAGILLLYLLVRVTKTIFGRRARRS